MHTSPTTPTPSWAARALIGCMQRVRALGYTDADLAAIADLHRSQPGRWARGTSRPSPDALSSIGAHILQEHPEQGPRVVLELCAAAGYPGVAEGLGVHLPLTGPAEAVTDPNTGLVWQMVQAVRARAADAGLSPEEQQKIVERALRTATEQADLWINTAQLNVLRAEMNKPPQNGLVAGSGHDAE